MEKQLNKGRNMMWAMPAPYIKTFESKEDIIGVFLKLVTVFNGIRLGPREVEFLTYMMLRDGLVTQLGRKLYREKHSLGKVDVDNLVKRLKRKKVLTGARDTLKLHPKIVLNFKDDNYIFQFKVIGNG